jgi:hypothetical protein
MITISIEIHFTTLYMADLGTRAQPLGERAQAGKNKGEERPTNSAAERDYLVFSQHFNPANVRSLIVTC